MAVASGSSQPRFSAGWTQPKSSQLTVRRKGRPRELQGHGIGSDRGSLPIGSQEELPGQTPPGHRLAYIRYREKQLEEKGTKEVRQKQQDGKSFLYSESPIKEEWSNPCERKVRLDGKPVNCLSPLPVERKKMWVAPERKVIFYDDKVQGCIHLRMPVNENVHFDTPEEFHRGYPKWYNKDTGEWVSVTELDEEQQIAYDQWVEPRRYRVNLCTEGFSYFIVSQEQLFLSYSHMWKERDDLRLEKEELQQLVGTHLEEIEILREKRDNFLGLWEQAIKEQDILKKRLDKRDQECRELLEEVAYLRGQQRAEAERLIREKQELERVASSQEEELERLYRQFSLCELGSEAIEEPATIQTVDPPSYEQATS